jgi:hypothetical protein
MLPVVWVIDGGSTPRIGLIRRQIECRRAVGFPSATMAWLPIKYREFYDVPRAIVVERDGELYLFDSSFDGDADEYPAYFGVYRLVACVASQLDSGRWEGLAAQGELLGRVSRRSSRVRTVPALPDE